MRSHEDYTDVKIIVSNFYMPTCCPYWKVGCTSEDDRTTREGMRAWKSIFDDKSTGDFMTIRLLIIFFSHLITEKKYKEREFFLSICRER